MFELKNGRVHGNGFIQFDLAPGIRFHIWPDKNKPLFAQKVRTPIHDHVFAFKSVVLCGTLHNITYNIKNDPMFGNHDVYEAQKSATEDTTLVKISQCPIKLSVRNVRDIKRGESYDFGAFDFHDTYSAGPGIAATLMIKTRVYDSSRPRVLCSVGEVPDNDFSRYSISPEVIQSYVDEVDDLMKSSNAPGAYWRV